MRRCSCDAPSNEGSQEDETLSETETTLDVEGMTCGSCVRHVEGALCTLEGVERVQVRMGDGKVVVVHREDGADGADFVAALEVAGYPSKIVG